jgi:hypothetical protein
MTAVAAAVMRLARRHRLHALRRHQPSGQLLHPSQRPAVLTTWTTIFRSDPAQMSKFEPTAHVPWAFFMGSGHFQMTSPELLNSQCTDE